MPARKKLSTQLRNAQLSIKIDGRIYDEYKKVLDEEGVSITDDIEGYLKSRIGEIDLSAYGNSINLHELAKDVENLKKSMGELLAS